jgi:hypothetical protein
MESSQSNGSRAKGKQRALENDLDADDAKENIREPQQPNTSIRLVQSGDGNTTGIHSQEPSFLDLDTAVDSPPATTSRFPPRSTSVPESSQAEQTRYEPVRFSTGSQTTDIEGSDDQSQLIDAFRSSYGTHFTNGRDSSYSWMMSEPNSPSVTLDFARAANELAGILGEGSSGRTGQKTSIDSDQHNNNNNSRRAQAGQSDVYSEWDGADRARARASSWDSQAANEMMNLARAASLKSVTGVREALARRRENTAKHVNPAERESALSIADPFHYAVGGRYFSGQSILITDYMRACYQQYESAPNSEDHSKVEELEIPSTDSMPSSALHQYYFDPPRSETNDQHADDSEIRPTSVYAYPVTPPTLHTGQFASPESGMSNGSETPQQQTTSANNKAKINYQRPYHRSFASANQQQQQQQQASLPAPAEAYQDRSTSDDPQYAKYSIYASSSTYSPGSANPGVSESKFPQHPPPLPYSDSAATQLAYANGSPAQAAQSRQGNATTNGKLASPMSQSTATFINGREADIPFANSTVVKRQDSPLGAPRPPFAMQRTGTTSSNMSFNESPSISDMSSARGDMSRSQKGAVARSPSSSIASAIAKHRAQREAAGLTTEGEYYVDPKSGKHYFVAASGTLGGGGKTAKSAEGKENNDPSLDVRSSGEKKRNKERRKLYKKESGWEVTKVKPRSPPQQQPSGNNLLATSQSRLMQPDGVGAGTYDPRSYQNGSQSGWDGSSGDEDTPSKGWKPWSGNNKKSNTSREGTPTTSPSQRVLQNGTTTAMRENGNGNEQEWIWHEPRTPVPDLYGGMMDGSPSGSSSYNTQHGLRTPNTAATTPASSASKGNNSIPRIIQPGHSPTNQPTKYSPSNGSRPGMHDRSGSLYSNYSYYGDLPANSPVLQQSHNIPDYSPSLTDPSPTKSPLPSPYIAPNSDHFQLGYDSSKPEGSGTLHKAKRSNSIQLLAVSSHDKLTVPKMGTAGKAGNQALDLSRMDPNDPLVCLHLGIDAHERGELEKSAVLFEKSAKQGCGLGMLMYGLALRHGWVSWAFLLLLT